MSSRKLIAAVVTTYHARSHADVLVGKFVRGFPTDDGVLPPLVDIASLYMDQLHPEDLGQALAQEHGIRLCRSIPEALCLGGDELAVDGVLSIAEQGDYATNEKGQQLYPRRHFFEQISGVMARSGRAVPVFNDKHLASTWKDAHWMYERARELGIPFMAGSSNPLFWRDPWLEHDPGTIIDEALVISYGHVEAYGYHGFEALQAMVERRRGAETGIRAVQCLRGEAVWEAQRQGRWSRDLAEAALEVVHKTASPTGPFEDHWDKPVAFMLEYADGLRATVLHLDSYTGYVRGRSYAARVGGQVVATGMHGLHGPPFTHFSYLGLNVQDMFVTGRPRYPVERTLLVTGAMAALMDSSWQGQVRIDTPHLHITYAPSTEPAIQPTSPGPCGASVEARED
jgi:hypothetical protein